MDQGSSTNDIILFFSKTDVSKFFNFLTWVSHHFLELIARNNTFHPIFCFEIEIVKKKFLGKGDLIELER